MPKAQPQGVLEAIDICERVGSVFSLLGCIFIIATFSLSKAFRKPINRLVFYASFGNMATNVATLMARRYVTELNSFGCQFQAFLIQMFMPADALWTLAMAVNVYLTFYFKFDARKLRSMEIWYILLCYGVPFIPAIVFIFVNSESSGRMYGDAILWCWVSSEWDIFRIATFYAPVWVVILVTFFIYVRTGGEIYRKRKQLHNFGGTSSGNEPEPLTMDDPYSVKTTEVKVTTESAVQLEDGIDLSPLGRREPSQTVSNAAYSVSISADIPDHKRVSGDYTLPVQDDVDARPPQTAYGRGRGKRRANFEANNAAWSYSKCALLFFSALLITWIPSTANRVYSVVNIGDYSPPLEIMSALVLPLQGFWNAMIYMVTSWMAVKIFFSDLARGASRRPASTHFPEDSKNNTHNFAIRLHSRSRTRNNVESESMTELAHSDRASSTEDPKEQER